MFSDIVLFKINSTLGKTCSLLVKIGDRHNILIHFSCPHVNRYYLHFWALGNKSRENARKTGKVRKKSGNFMRGKKWEPWVYPRSCQISDKFYVKKISQTRLLEMLHRKTHWKSQHLLREGLAKHRLKLLHEQAKLPKCRKSPTHVIGMLASVGFRIYSRQHCVSRIFWFDGYVLYFYLRELYKLMCFKYSVYPQCTSWWIAWLALAEGLWSFFSEWMLITSEQCQSDHLVKQGKCYFLGLLLTLFTMRQTGCLPILASFTSGLQSDNLMHRMAIVMFSIFW